MLQKSGARFQYLKAMPQQERGGKTWRVVSDVVKHWSGEVTHRVLAQGLDKPEAHRLARSHRPALG